jgi:hypothetical protein
MPLAGTAESRLYSLASENTALLTQVERMKADQERAALCRQIEKLHAQRTIDLQMEQLRREIDGVKMRAATARAKAKARVESRDLKAEVDKKVLRLEMKAGFDKRDLLLKIQQVKQDSQMQHLELQNRLERKDAEVNQLNQRISIFELHFAQKMQLRAPQNMQVPLSLSGQLLGQTNGAPMVGPVQAGSMVQMQKSNNAAVPQAIPRAIGSNTKVNTLLELERMGIHQKKADPEKTVEATVVCISAADGGSLHRTIASPTDGNIISVDNNPQKKGYQKVVSGTIPLSISVASGTIPLPVGSKHHFFLSHCQVGVHRIPHCYPLNRNDFTCRLFIVAAGDRWRPDQRNLP